MAGGGFVLVIAAYILIAIMIGGVVVIRVKKFIQRMKGKNMRFFASLFALFFVCTGAAVYFIEVSQAPAAQLPMREFVQLPTPVVEKVATTKLPTRGMFRVERYPEGSSNFR